MKTSSFQVHIEKALKAYPHPKIDRSIVDRAMALALSPSLKWWPLIVGGGLGFAAFIMMLQTIAMEYSTGVFSTAYYMSVPLSLSMTIGATLFKIMTEYGNWMLGATLLFIAFEITINRKFVLQMIKTEPA